MFLSHLFPVVGDGLLLHTVHRFRCVLLYGKCFPTRRGSCIIGNLPMGRRCGGQLGDDFKDNRGCTSSFTSCKRNCFCVLMFESGK